MFIIIIDKIHIQTLIPEVNEVQIRKPKRQSIIEMANYLKNELGKADGMMIKLYV